MKKLLIALCLDRTSYSKVNSIKAINIKRRPVAKNIIAAFVSFFWFLVNSPFNKK